MQAVWDHPAIVAMRAEFSQMVWGIERHVRTVEPMTWFLIALAVGAMWMFFVRKPAK